MPLHIDDAEIDFRLCLPVAVALKNIKTEMASRSVTPRFALALMKKYFQPLIPECHQDVLGRRIKTSWEDMHWAYAEMIFRSGQPIGLLTDIGLAMQWICTFTTQPPRDFPVTEPIEVDYFLQMCRQTDSSMEHFRYLDNGAFDVFRACKYCWRQPVPGRSICCRHATGHKHEPIELSNSAATTAKSSFAGYKESSRQKNAFDKMLNQILTKEVWEFHESSFTSPTLLPEQNKWDWLCVRRPMVSHLLLTQNKQTTDEVIIEELLSILHNAQGLVASHQQPYIKANSLIKSNPFLIWPMLLRAEAWLVARKNLRDKWGGRRD